MLHPVIESIAKNNKVPGVKFGVVATEDTGLNFSTMMNVREGTNISRYER